MRKSAAMAAPERMEGLPRSSGWKPKVAKPPEMRQVERRRKSVNSDEM